MDFATGLGLVAGSIVVVTLILMGGDLRMFYDVHAVIIIFGGSISATLIRFPVSAILHGLPLGAKFAFTISSTTPRELVDEIAGLAEIARKSGPVGLEKVTPDDPFLAKGVRFVADGYDADFIRDNLERDRDNFLTHLDEGSKIYRAIGDCAPAFGMIGTLIGMVQMEVNRTLIIDGILMIRDSKSPTLVREMLLAYLPEKHRDHEAELAPA
jgi:chemotaxis protein MotA